jgi:uncharacterized Zn finger protein (UPF0148 family)
MYTKNGRWAMKYDKCIICGTTERKHKGNGMCMNCYREKHKKRNSEYHKKYQEKNKEKIKEYSKMYRKENKEKVLSSGRKWKKENSEKVKEIGIIYRKNNLEKLRQCSNKYYSNNVAKISLRTKLRRQNESRFKLKCNISCLVNQKLKYRLFSKNKKSTWGFLPYTVEELMSHLESLFTKGMTWENHGRFGWHIDHKIPDCKFNYESVEDKGFQECWALKNLQPLWWRDNLIKGGKTIIN